MHNGKQVLLVEDDEVIQKLITRLCDRHGIMVTVADNQDNTNRAFADAEIFDMFFVDLILPEITGWEVLQKIKNNPACNGKPIIVFTGAILSKNEKENILQQATAIVEKKLFSLQLFDEILDKNLKEHGRARGASPGLTPVRGSG